MNYNNVLYFNDDIDIRLCTKNGSSTLKNAWSAIYNKPTTQLDLLYRCMKNQDLFNPPFRHGSYRIAIKRDPIERFLSAACMIKLNMWSPKSHETWNDTLKDLVDLTNFDKTIENLETNKIKDFHFFSQTVLMGNINEYDKIYYVHELPTLLEWLKIKCKTKAEITKIWTNKSKNNYEDIILSDAQKLRIMKLYAKDYANGWY